VGPRSAQRGHAGRGVPLGGRHGNQLFLLRGTAASRFRPSVRYPFGRGKELYFWSFLVASSVSWAAGGCFMEGSIDCATLPARRGLAFNLAVLGIAAFFELAVAFRVALKDFNRRRGGRSLVRTVRETKDRLLVVLFEDSVAVLGLAVAAIGLLLSEWTGAHEWDAVASMVIGLLLGATALVLAVETKVCWWGIGRREVRSAIRTAVMASRSGDGGPAAHHAPGPTRYWSTWICGGRGPERGGGRGSRSAGRAEIRRLVPEATRVFIELGRRAEGQQPAQGRRPPPRGSGSLQLGPERAASSRRSSGRANTAASINSAMGWRGRRTPGPGGDRAD